MYKGENNYALRYASCNGHVEIVKLLIAHGADVQADNNRALRWASNNGCLEVVKLLIAHGADVQADNNRALRWASYNGHVETVKLLISHGANVQVDDNYAIKSASENGHLEVVKLLIAHGANVQADDNYALRYASENGYVEIVKLLISLNCEITDDIIKIAKPNVQEYLKSILNKSYYGIVYDVKLDIVLPELLELHRNNKYYYVYDYSSDEKGKFIPNLISRYTILNSLGYGEPRHIEF